MENKTDKLTLGGIWSDDTKLRRVFSWLTRIGAAPKFGSLPIHYYQQDQCKAIDDLIAAAKMKNLDLETMAIRCKGNCFEARTRHQWLIFAVLICGKIVAR